MTDPALHSRNEHFWRFFIQINLEANAPNSTLLPYPQSIPKKRVSGFRRVRHSPVRHPTWTKDEEKKYIAGFYPLWKANQDKKQKQKEAGPPTKKKIEKPFDALRTWMNSYPWDLFTVLGEGYCPPQDETIQRFRQIEARLNKTFICQNYHHLRPDDRFLMMISFEGDRDFGDEHANIVVSVPPFSRKGGLSHEELIGRLPFWINILWDDLSHKPWLWSPLRYKTHSAWLDWRNNLPTFYANELGELCERNNRKKTIPLMIGLCRDQGAKYSLKDVKNEEKEVELKWRFITPPKYIKFENQNLNVCKNRNKQKRHLLEREQQNRRWLNQSLQT